MLSSERPEPFLSKVDAMRTGDGKEFPRNPRDRVNALVNALNFGPKSVALLLIPPHESLTVRELYEEYREIFSGTGVDQFSKQNLTNYIKKFAANGLVETYLDQDNVARGELSDRRLVTKVRLTQEGIRYGLPAAAGQLIAEDALRESTAPYFIESASDQEGPFTISSVLSLLSLHTARVRAKDVAKAVGQPNRDFSSLLIRLNRHGLVDYNGFAAKSGEVAVYRIVNMESRPPVFSGLFPHFTKKLIDAVQIVSVRNPEFTGDQIVDWLPDEVRNAYKRDVLRVEVSRAVAEMVRIGMLELTKEPGAAPTHKGMVLLHTYLRLVDALTRDRPEAFYEGARIVDEVAGDLSQYAARTGERYMPHSHSKKFNEYPENFNGLTAFLAAAEGPTSIMDISQQLGLTEATVRNYLQRLQKGEVVVDGVSYTLRKSMHRGLVFAQLISSR